MAPLTKGMDQITLLLTMLVCGAFSFGVTYKAAVRLDMDGQITCTSGAESGVCYDPLNCLRVSGMFGNNCPDSQGVCCLFYRQCNQQSSQEVSYFRNTDKEAGSGCSYRVVKRSSIYCAMRVNLIQLDLPGDCQTSLSIEGIYKGENKGKLIFPERSDSDKICSTEAGIKYSFDTRNVDEVRVNVQSFGQMTGKWKIRVIQVPCKDEITSYQASHIQAIWRPTDTDRPSTATCWWNCGLSSSTTPPTPRPVTDSNPFSQSVGYSQCGIKGPNRRRYDLNFRTVQGESTPFVEDMEFGNLSTTGRNESIFAEVVNRIKSAPDYLPMRNRLESGKSSGPREYPWQVCMKVRGRFHCSASIIGDQYVLTAAHCVSRYRHSPQTLYLTLGDWDLSTSRDQTNVVPTVERVTVHPQYSRTTLRNDLAVLKLTKKIQFAEHIRPICLPPEGLDPTGRLALVTGWHRDENNQLKPKLRELASEVTNNSYCERQWDKNGAPGGFITQNMMCMSPIGGDSCDGDSGGPSIMTINGIEHQIGIVSFGSGSCVDPDLPEVYTRVTSYLDWIRAQMT